MEERVRKVLDDGTARWLAHYAETIREREARYEDVDVRGLFGEDVDDDEESLPALFGAYPQHWRGLEFYLSDQATGHGDVVWAAGEHLAACVLEGKLRVEGLRVLELGAGAGLPSLACSRRGATVVATDAPGPSILCLALAALNSPNLQVRRLEWGETLDAPTFDLVLAADCVYDVDAHPALLRTIRESLGPRPARAVIAFALHGNAKDADVLGFLDKARDNNAFRVEYVGAAQRAVSDTMQARCLIDADTDDGRKRSRVHTYILHPTT